MKPRILVIASWYPTTESPSVGSFCKEQTEMVKDDFDIRVIYPKLKLVSKIDTARKLFRANHSQQRENLLGSVKGIELETFVSTFLPYKTQIAYLADQCAGYLQSLRKEDWTPDIIHAHGTRPAGLVAASLSKPLGIPYLITEHHSLLVSDFDGESWPLYKQAQEDASLVMVVSNELKKMILMNGVDCKVTVVGNLLDEDLFQPAPPPSKNNSLNILFIAVPAKTKDIPTFINALGLLRSLGIHDFLATMIIPDVKADLTRDDILRLTEQAGIRNNCRIMGSVKHDEIPALIYQTDVLVSTSITETFGLSVAEAILCGKPVIATRSGGVEDFVTPENGNLVNIGDQKAISLALSELIGGSRMDAVKARKDMIDRFGKKAFKERICEIYNKSLHG